MAINNVVSDFAFGKNGEVYTLHRIYDKEKLSLIQILDSKERICQVVFYKDGNHIAGRTLYNSNTGKELKTITYRADGKTICSIRELNPDGKIKRIMFMKPCGKKLSSIITYNEDGNETKCTIFDENGKAQIIQI